ncbi:helix-turn-helix domain-containing protein [Rhodohalobacter sulfatireducens]|uniref:Helix-turn-helix domain-containing protein n=1 Tax=Rhodohalobacter sulfatireducens TaxID=2911366 RepID=A0ABS9KBA3_9BACT|nr:helix-turn-helix domain-containing protein [Rhodohalobacter sulfatireducens]MCG2588119.1 helix-turn-helix domain-containing protein [Rhodohalobacter sulfatireducens]MDR9367131.1 helix-turn-helix domain-containing protein [Balneolaceae bacterium]MDR9410156.1 helix-turn-helix domain-containing protein [Balneolaceae bacterium]
MSTKNSDISPRRTKIIDVLEEAGEELQIREIVERTDLDYNNARSALSEMTSMGLIERVQRGVYDLPERVQKKEMENPDHPIQKILQNQQILKVLLNTVITNKALMEALLLGQQEIIQALRTLSTKNEEDEEAIKNLEEVFAKRIEWHFDVAAEQVTAQYTKLPEEVFDVLVAPLTRDKDSKNKILDPLKTNDFKKKKKEQKKKSDTSE